MDLAFHTAALRDVGIFHVCFRSDILRDLRDVLCVDPPVALGEVETAVGIQKVHIGLPERIHSSYVLPVAFELVGDQLAAAA